MHYLQLAGLVLVLFVLGRLALAVYRFVILPPAGKRNWPRARWARFRHRWLMHNLGLAYMDPHRKATRPVKFGTSVKVQPVDMASPGRLRFPRARFRPDEFGIIARVKTVPSADRLAFDKQAVHIANAWKCHRVSVTQPRPGRLIVRGVRTDPLTLPFEAPPGLYGSSDTSQTPPGRSIFGLRPEGTSAKTLRLYAGRDEWGDNRWLPLAGTTGITIGGLPDYGKTMLVLSWLMQLAGSGAVQFVIIDGKGGGDYSAWRDRAWIYSGDELPAAAAALEQVHSLMRSRLALIEAGSTPRNRWHVGPTPDWPLIVTVVDECHTFLDLDAVKGQPAADKQVRACRTMGGQLVRKGRSVLMLTVWITQKQTSDAIPTAIRDNCRLGLSFAVKTKDAAVAGLGEGIREYPSFCPTGLQDPAYVGVATASLATAHSPFVRIRVPQLDEAAADERARLTASLRSDPTQEHQLEPENVSPPVLRAVV